MDEESKSLELEGSIRTLEREQSSLKKHAAKLQAKVSSHSVSLRPTDPVFTRPVRVRVFN